MSFFFKWPNHEGLVTPSPTLSGYIMSFIYSFDEKSFFLISGSGGFILPLSGPATKKKKNGLAYSV